MEIVNWEMEGRGEGGLSAKARAHWGKMADVQFGVSADRASRSRDRHRTQCARLSLLPFSLFLYIFLFLSICLSVSLSICSST